MCMFSRPVREVAATRIFARHLDGGDQALVYSMNVELGEPTAMILPLPVPADPAEDAVRFVDLSGYPKFFEDLHRAFPTPVARGGAFAARSLGLESNATLKVHRVGSFEASFVPKLADFARLDRRFRLADDVWSKLPYDDWGFAVFQLAEKSSLLGKLFGKAAPSKQTIHPMAFVFPRRDPRTLFFPTLHVHDGAVHRLANFDHQLYCQPDALTAATFTWRTSAGPLGDYVDAAKAHSLIDPNAPGYILSILGMSHNRDVTLTPPDITLDALRPQRASFALRLSANPAYFAEDVDEPFATQRRVARHHLPEVGQRVADALETLLASKPEWRLEAYDDDAVEYAMSSTHTIEGQTEIRLSAPGQLPPWESSWKAPTGRGLVRFGVLHEKLGSLAVMLTFAELPQSETYQAIQRELDRVVSDVWQAIGETIAS